MTEHTDTAEIPDTAAEVIDLFNRGGGAEPEPEAPAYHTILEVWRELLKPAAAEAKANPSPTWAGKMVQTYPDLTFADCLAVRDRLMAKLGHLLDVVVFEIEAHPGCLDHTSPEEDVEENSEIYKSILLTWQQLFLQWELEWTCNTLVAPAEFASMAEAHRILFGDSSRPGLSAHLDNIKFAYTEADQLTVAETLAEQRDAYLEVTGE